MLQRSRGRRTAGFTLIEVMVVVAILAILAAVVVPRVMDEPAKARAAKVKQDIRAIESALDLYKLDNYRYPTTDQRPRGEELQGRRLPARAAAGSLGQPLPVPEPGRARRDRHLLAGRRRRAGRRGEQRRHRQLEHRFAGLTR